MSEPAEVFPVSRFIRDEMEARAWSLDDLLDRMPGDRRTNHLWIDLVLESENFSLELQRDLLLGDAAPLAHAFGTSTELWENLDTAYRKHVNALLAERSKKP